MSNEITFRREMNKPSVMRRDAIVERMGIVPMEGGQDGPFGKVIYAGIQVYLHNSVSIKREVKKHNEDEGVSEIYFPLIGKFQVTRGNDIETLEGKLKAGDTKGARYIMSYDETSKEYSLTVRNSKEEFEPIPGFVIPGNTDHSTQQIDDSLSTFFAIKIDTNVSTIST